ncbi:MAG: RelA/SpoT domain-containing protein [Alphaproteobacteria bacterium]|nr:RelA/SpoT domain-containing protein [Alphaproteobacteria bacterium]
MEARNIEPQFSLEQVDHAAENARAALMARKSVAAADEEIIENRRAAHAHILNTWQATLRGRVKKSQSQVVFAQRQKRLPTIYDKFLRWPKIPFSLMQDIAGCRLIFENHEELHNFRNALHASSSMKHKLIKTSDYIQAPKKSGYRGIHDIYEYHTQNRPDRSKKWDGLKLEIQYRTIIQHYWATAVEIADCLTKGRIKYSDGNKDYLKFFQLASEMFARVYERMTSCFHGKSDQELVKEFEDIEARIRLLAKLKAAKTANIKNKFKSGNNVILDQYFDDNGDAQINIEEFKSLPLAQKRYFELEQANPTHDIVLVRSNDIDSRNSIKNAYRNYFVDTVDFVKYLEKALIVLRH